MRLRIILLNEDDATPLPLRPLQLDRRDHELEQVALVHGAVHALDVPRAHRPSWSVGARSLGDVLLRERPNAELAVPV